MAKVIALGRTIRPLVHPADMARALIVCGSALALIMADKALPF